MALEVKIYPKNSKNASLFIEVSNEQEKARASTTQEEEIYRRRSSVILEMITVGIDMDRNTLFVIVIIIFLDLLWTLATVTPDPWQHILVLLIYDVIACFPLLFLPFFQTDRLVHSYHAIVWLLPVTLPFVVLTMIILVYFRDDGWVSFAIFALLGFALCTIYLCAWLLNFKITVRVFWLVIVISLAVFTIPIVSYVALKQKEFFQVLICILETIMIFSVHAMAFKKDLSKNHLAMNTIFMFIATIFENLRFVCFLDVFQSFHKKPEEAFEQLATMVILNVCFQIYSQTDLCFFIAAKLQTKVGVNENRAFPRMIFSLFLVIVGSFSPSGLTAVQELIGNSKELENTTRQYYAFVWATTFKIPITFSAYILLRKFYGIKGSSDYEYVVARWGYVMAIYLSQEIFAEIICRYVDFKLSKKWVDYHGRYSFPKIMLKHYQNEGFYVCTILLLLGAVMDTAVLNQFK